MKGTPYRRSTNVFGASKTHTNDSRQSSNKLHLHYKLLTILLNFHDPIANEETTSVTPKRCTSISFQRLLKHVKN